MSWLLTLSLAFSCLLGGRPPDLTPRDTRIKIEEILRAHATYHTLNQELMKRSFQNFLESLDPIKTYLLEDEIVRWTAPSEELLNNALEDFQHEKFTEFEQMYQVMLKALPRRGDIEKTLQSVQPQQGDPLELKNLTWTSSIEALTERIAMIKGLQIATADKLDPDDKNSFTQRIERRRMNREMELTSDSPENRKRLILSYVLKAVSSSLDSQTTYFTPTEASQFMTQMQQRLFGIGAQLRDDLNGLTIMRILEGSPASEEKSLKIGDRIIAVNKEPIIGLDTSEAVELIRGPEGTPVALTLLRKMHENENNYEKFEVTLKRGEIVFKEARLDKIIHPFGDGVIGVLRLFSLSRS
ncbi:MAG: PDZ domain-containing protein [Rhabdochlamydiaceae bacterium]|jgi:carboxyl-terminal processing protease